MAEINNVIAEASQDLQTIEDFVNLPADSDVRPRLLPSVNVGTLAGARQAIFEAGGLPATPFATKALMTASSLADGKYAQVTDDTVNNGLYLKADGVWVKSDYDPLAKAIAYTDSKTVTATNQAEDLHFFTDNSGAVVASINDRGVFDSQGLTVNGEPLDVKSSVTNNNDESTHLLTDEQGNVLFEIDKYGMPDASFSFLGINEMRSGAFSQKDVNKTGVTLDRISIAGDTPINFDVLVAAQGSDGTLTQRMPSAIKVADNKLFVAFAQFSTYNSDSVDGRLVGRFVTYDLQAQTATVGATQVILGEKTGNLNRHPHFIKLNDRILLIFNKAGFELVVYESFDECETWSLKTTDLNSLTNSFPLALGLDSVVRIEQGEYAGRIIMALYSGAGTVANLYSDDNGSAWQKGVIYTGSIVTPNTPALTEVAVALDSQNNLIFGFRNETASTDARHMVFAKSTDGGKTMQFFEQDNKTVIVPVQFSLKQIAPNEYSGVPKILSAAASHGTLRKSGRLRLSYDDCKSWAIEKQLFDGNDTFGYNSILPLDAKNYAVIYEDGDLNKVHNVRIKFINLKEVYA